MVHGGLGVGEGGGRCFVEVDILIFIRNCYLRERAKVGGRG